MTQYYNQDDNGYATDATDAEVSEAADDEDYESYLESQRFSEEESSIAMSASFNDPSSTAKPSSSSHRDFV